MRSTEYNSRYRDGGVSCGADWFQDRNPTTHDRLILTTSKLSGIKMSSDLGSFRSNVLFLNQYGCRCELIRLVWTWEVRNTLDSSTLSIEAQMQHGLKTHRTQI